MDIISEQMNTGSFDLCNIFVDVIRLFDPAVQMSATPVPAHCTLLPDAPRRARSRYHCGRARGQCD